MALRAFCSIVVVLCALGCTEPEAGRKAAQARLDYQAEELAELLGEANSRVSSDESALLIQLAFGREADLDLYVTDPLLETVYFANHQSRSEGRISDDVRCDSQALRIEEVHFDHPMAGRYRVGVDFPQQCAGNSQSAVFVVSVLNQGKRQELVGSVALQQFNVVVLEFDVE